jgi:hypothetical protein
VEILKETISPCAEIQGDSVGSSLGSQVLTEVMQPQQRGNKRVHPSPKGNGYIWVRNMKKDVKQYHPEGAGRECYKSPVALPLRRGRRSSNLVLRVLESIRSPKALPVRQKGCKLSSISVLRVANSHCSLTCEKMKEIHQLGPEGQENLSEILQPHQ